MSSSQKVSFETKKRESQINNSMANPQKQTLRSFTNRCEGNKNQQKTKHENIKYNMLSETTSRKFYSSKKKQLSNQPPTIGLSSSLSSRRFEEANLNRDQSQYSLNYLRADDGDRIERVIKKLQSSKGLKKMMLHGESKRMKTNINEYAGKATKRGDHSFAMSPSQTNHHHSHFRYNSSSNEDFDEVQFVKRELVLKIESLIKKSVRFQEKSLWSCLYEGYEDLKSCSQKDAISRQENLFYESFTKLLQRYLWRDDGGRIRNSKENHVRDGHKQPSCSNGFSKMKKASYFRVQIQKSSPQEKIQLHHDQSLWKECSSPFEQEKNKNYQKYRADRESFAQSSLTYDQHSRTNPIFPTAMVSKLQLENIKLLKENEMLKKKLIALATGRKDSSSDLSNSMFSSSLPKGEMDMDIFDGLKAVISSEFSSQDPAASSQLSEHLQKIQRQISSLKQKLFDCQQQNVGLKNQISILDDNLATLRDEKQNLSKKFTQLKNTNENLCGTVMEAQIQSQMATDKLNKWSSTIGFQQQEIVSFQMELENIKTEYKELSRKYKLVLRKMGKANGGGSYGSSQQPQLCQKYYETFQEQIETFLKVRTIFLQKDASNNIDKRNVSSLPSTNGGGQLAAGSDSRNPQNYHSNNEMYRQYMTQKETVHNTSGIKRTCREHYGYFKPNFYNFVESYMDLHGIDENTSLNNHTESSNLFPTIRGILDSKLNEYLMANPIHSVKEFSTFCYAWLCRFKIHSRSKRIIELKEDVVATTGNCGQKDVIANFYLSVMSEKLNYNWEVITFREFMMDTLTKDEIYFYLICRFSLFNGDMVSDDNMKWLYEEICYVSVGEALKLLQKYVLDLGYRKRIEDYLKRFIIYQRKRALLDGHFVLRILLQYYQAKKSQDFVNLHSLAQILKTQKRQQEIKSKQKSQFEDGGCGFTSFDSFLKLFEYNFPYLSIMDKVEVYRKAYSSSRGHINLEVILTILTEEGYLCYEVKSVFNEDQIKKRKKNEKDSLTVATTKKPESLKKEEIKETDSHNGDTKSTQKIQITGDNGVIGPSENEQETVVKAVVSGSNGYDGSITMDLDYVIEPPYGQLYEYEAFLKRFANSTLEMEVSLLGIQSLRSKFGHSSTDSHQYSSTGSHLNSNDLTPYNMLKKIQYIFNLCVLELQKLIFSKKITLETFSGILLEAVEFEKRFLKLTCEKKEIMNIMHKFKRETAGRKILRFYRKKRNQMHRNFIFNTRDDYEETDEKICNIRNEFSNMIVNLKDKFNGNGSDD